MRGIWSARSWRSSVARALIVAAALALGRWQPTLLLLLLYPMAAFVLAFGLARWARVVGPKPRPYQPRDPDAGRWLDAPVAELDKSTIGKLLASRLGRDPRVHAVVPSRASSTCTDALYDPELDG